MCNEIFILMDDSGKLNNNENSCIFGGLFFYSSKEYLNFINQYKSVINDLKCKYCNQNKENCNSDCIEIKATTKLKQSDRRRIFNLVKKQNNYGVFIDNNKIYSRIMNDKASRGRYCDYAQKLIIKQIVLHSINSKLIDPTKDLILHIKSDDAKTKSNGYYSLKNSIYEELINGIINFDYSKIHKPILTGKLKVNLKMYNSKFHYGIQSADMISNYLHREYEQFLLKQKDISATTSFIEVKLFLP